MIIMNFSKAFHTVPHNWLLNKLNRYGIDNKTGWISKFLTCREQRVVVSGEHSPWTHVKSGVSQGTVLGPLLFLIYINDQPDNIHNNTWLITQQSCAPNLDRLTPPGVLASTSTRQDKTRQDKTRQDKTRQDKTRQDKTRQDKTRQEAYTRVHTRL